jgi:hypothetical protein
MKWNPIIAADYIDRITLQIEFIINILFSIYISNTLLKFIKT